MKKHFTHSAILFFLVLSLAQCTQVTSYMFEEEDLEFIDELTLVGSPNMNRNMPLKVDFVIVKDAIIAEHVAKLTARQFMKHRKQLKRDHPESIKIKSFELIPNQSVVMPMKYLKTEVAAAFIFADYNNQLPNRWTIYTADCVKVELLEKTVNITSHKWNAQQKVKHARENDGVVVLS